MNSIIKQFKSLNFCTLIKFKSIFYRYQKKNKELLNTFTILKNILFVCII